MKLTTIIATAVLLLSALSVSARPPRVLEDGREVSAAMLTMPATYDGTVTIKGCTACERVTLTLSRDAQFFIGQRAVSFTELKRHLLDQPKSNLLVVSPINQKVVSRISASAPDVQ